MSTRDLTTALPVLMSELVLGSPDPKAGTSMLNRGDDGLLRSLDKISATGASITSAGGATIAAHVDHIRYGLALLNRWAASEPTPWQTADWTESWRRSTVSDDEWKSLRASLRREAEGWIEALRTPRELNERELQWTIGSIAHLAYHLGAIRQIDRAARGPTAEDELPFNT